MSQTIYKMAGKADPFARIPHTMLEDERLSWKAKGILAYLCGKPDGWRTRVTDIVRHGSDGKHAVWSALKELRMAGYAELSQLRDGGRFREWVWKVSDSPIFSPLPDFPHLENQHHSKNESLQRRKSKESEETPFASLQGATVVSEESQPEYEPVWKPITEPKEKQLKRIRPPKDYPSEREFEEFIETSGCDHIAMGKRGDLYHRLCLDKWHKWKGRRWQKIRDWRKYVLALESTIAAATER